MIRKVNTSEAENIAEISDGSPVLDQEFTSMLLDLSEILDNSTDSQNGSSEVETNSTDTHLSESEINGILKDLAGLGEENSAELPAPVLTTKATSTIPVTVKVTEAVVETGNGTDMEVVTENNVENLTTISLPSTESTPELKQKFGENPASVEIDNNSSLVTTTAGNTYVLIYFNSQPFLLTTVIF